MPNFQKRAVPHKHTCCVCSKYLGCANDMCRLGNYSVCPDNEDCQRIYENATIHMAGVEGNKKLRCCGLLPDETALGDRMTYYGPHVTCKGVGVEMDPAAVQAARARAQAVMAASIEAGGVGVTDDSFIPTGGQQASGPYSPMWPDKGAAIGEGAVVPVQGAIWREEGGPSSLSIAGIPPERRLSRPVTPHLG